jgi:hypothetical protein
MTTSTKELVEELTHESIHIRDGQCDDEFHSALLSKAAQRLRELDEQVKQQINDYGCGMAIVNLMRKPDCVWINGDSDEEFETSCGHTFTFIDGGISDNDCKFCQYCGRAVKLGGTPNE